MRWELLEAAANRIHIEDGSMTSIPPGEHHYYLWNLVRTFYSNERGSLSIFVYGDQEKPPLIKYIHAALNHMLCFQGLFFCPEAASLLLHNFCIYHISPPGHKLGAAAICPDDPVLSVEDLLVRFSRSLTILGTKVEGILRQSVDVEEVERRVQDYETGKTEFGSDEDAHVVSDCHVIRELTTSHVPASCCTALLEAHRIDRKEARVNAMRAAILETFPEPNRRLLQILKMMHYFFTFI
ncbi:putative Rho GTPase activation protein [Helianthus debilis subsp. tardiflorus]